VVAITSLRTFCLCCVSTIQPVQSGHFQSTRICRTSYCRWQHQRRWDRQNTRCQCPCKTLPVNGKKTRYCQPGLWSRARQDLTAHHDVDVVISDDGMQHYAMFRDVELAVVDGQRMLGNRWLLPAGPLREPPGRLSMVDIVAVQKANNAASNLDKTTPPLIAHSTNWPVTGHFYLEIEALKNLADQHVIALETLNGRQVHAIAGVGNPERYFSSLSAAGLDVHGHAMPDHHRYTIEDIAFDDQLPILITSKDAVKIRTLDVDLKGIYEVCVVANFDSDLDQAIDKMLTSLI